MKAGTLDPTTRNSRFGQASICGPSGLALGSGVNHASALVAAVTSRVDAPSPVSALELPFRGSAPECASWQATAFTAAFGLAPQGFVTMSLGMHCMPCSAISSSIAGKSLSRTSSQNSVIVQQGPRPDFGVSDAVAAHSMILRASSMNEHRCGVAGPTVAVTAGATRHHIGTTGPPRPSASVDGWPTSTHAPLSLMLCASPGSFAVCPSVCGTRICSSSSAKRYL